MTWCDCKLVWQYHGSRLNLTHSGGFLMDENTYITKFMSINLYLI